MDKQIAEARITAAVEGAMTSVVHGAVASVADMLDGVAEAIAVESESDTSVEVLAFLAGLKFAAQTVRMANE